MIATVYDNGAAGGPAVATAAPGERADREPAIRVLEEELASACGISNASAAWMVDLIADSLEAGLWQQAGIRSVQHWVGWQCGVSAGRALRLVSIARRRRDLPVAFGAFKDGELSEDQMAVVCRHTPGPCDASVTGFAKSATVAQLRRTLSRYTWKPPPGIDDGEPGDDDDGEHEPEPEPDLDAQRRVSFHFDDDGLWHLFARLSPDEGASFEAALLAARDELFHARFGEDSEDHNPNEIGWADALAHVADLAASPEATGHPVRERHRVHLHLRADTINDLFANQTSSGGGGGDGAAAWVLNLHLGPALPDSLRRYLLCDCDLIPVLEKFGIPVSVGRTQRSVPDRTRTLIEERDRGCRFPACTARRWLQVHHLWHWENGGPTDSHNLCCLCAWHHRQHHKGSFGVTGNADDPAGLVFTDQNGKVIRPGRPPKPPGDPPPVAARRHGVTPDPYQHPLGETLQDWSVWFQPHVA